MFPPFLSCVIPSLYRELPARIGAPPPPCPGPGPVRPCLEPQCGPRRSTIFPYFDGSVVSPYGPELKRTELSFFLLLIELPVFLCVWPKSDGAGHLYSVYRHEVTGCLPLESAGPVTKLNPLLHIHLVFFCPSLIPGPEVPSMNMNFGISDGGYISMPLMHTLCSNLRGYDKRPAFLPIRTLAQVGRYQPQSSLRKMGIICSLQKKISLRSNSHGSLETAFAALPKERLMMSLI